MADSQALALLALRRLHNRMGQVAPVAVHNGDGHENGSSDPTALTAGDRIALGRVLHRAIERTWLTLEMLFAQDALNTRLGRGGQVFASIFDNSAFQQLTSTPAPFRPTIWRQLHAARKAGPLAHGAVEVEDLLRQLSTLTRPSEPQALQDLEWYALWQLAADLARDGYPELRSLFEARSTGGESLLVGLVTSFVPFELGLEGNPPRVDLGLSLLPDEHIQW